MKLINNAERAYVAYNTAIYPKQTIEVEDKKVLDILLAQPGVKEFIDINTAKNIEKENQELKKEIESIKTKKTITKKTKKD